MKNYSIIAILAVLFAAMIVPQDIVAKDKKVKYLGHNYKGEVDSQKAPCGNGIINVNGLLIEGTFDGTTVTDAVVRKYGSYWTKIQGTVVYDESGDITIKAGAKFTTVYWKTGNQYNCTDEEKNEYKETLAKDSIVNYNNIEPRSLKMSYTYKPEFSHSAGLNPVKEVAIPYEIYLKDIKYHKDWRETVETQGYIDTFSAFNVENSNFDICNYKDSEGRIWNKFRKYSWSVKYPDGSYYEFKLGGGDSIKWKICYKDGTSIEYQCNLSRGGWISIGNSFSIFAEDSEGEIFSSLKSYDKKTIECDKSITLRSNYYDFKTLSSLETEKIIKENVLPYLKLKDPNQDIIIDVTEDETDYSGAFIGKYEKGKYINTYKQTKDNEAKDAAQIKQEYQKLTRRFGFSPDTKSARQLVVAGRSLSLIKEYYSFGYLYNKERYDNAFHGLRFKLYLDQGASKCYRMIDGYNTIHGHVWVQGDKITTVHWY